MPPSLSGVLWQTDEDDFAFPARKRRYRPL